MRAAHRLSPCLAGLLLAAPQLNAHADAVPGQGTWQTTLQARDLDRNGTTDAYYDTALNITWLRDANINGPMTWSQATDWASSLVFGGYSGWRLPTMQDVGQDGCNYATTGTDCGYNVLTQGGATVYSEMAHLYYVTLGNQAYYDTAGQYQPNYGLTNTGNFLNLQGYNYWTGLADATSPGNLAWSFSQDDGAQDSGGVGYAYFAMAVVTGDLAAPVPEPASFQLMALGLLLALAAKLTRKGGRQA